MPSPIKALSSSRQKPPCARQLFTQASFYKHTLEKGVVLPVKSHQSPIQEQPEGLLKFFASDDDVSEAQETVNKLSSLFEYYIQVSRDNVSKYSPSFLAYAEICDSVLSDRSFAPEKLSHYNDLSDSWKQYCLRAFLLVEEVKYPTTFYVVKDQPETLVTSEWVDTTLKAHRGGRARRAVDDITTLFKDFIHHPDSPPLFITDARVTVFFNMVIQISRGEMLSFDSFRLYPEDETEYRRLGHCYPQMFNHGSPQTQPWQLFTSEAVNYFIKAGMRYIEPISLLHWGGVLIKTPEQLIAYKIGKNPMAPAITKLIRNVKSRYQDYLAQATPTASLVNAQCILLSALIKSLVENHQLSYQSVLTLLHPARMNSIELIETVRQRAPAQGLGECWDALLATLFEDCEEAGIHVDSDLKDQLFIHPVEALSTSPILTPLTDLSPRSENGGIQFMEDLNSHYNEAIDILGELLGRDASPSSERLESGSDSEFESVDECTESLVLSPEGSEYHPPDQGRESALKATMFENIAALDVQIKTLDTNKHASAVDILRTLSRHLKGTVEQLFEGTTSDQEVADKFPQFKQQCERACNTALQKDNAVLASHRGLRQAVFTFLQTVTIVGAFYGAIRKACGYSYSFGIFKQNTRSEATVAAVSRSLTACAA